MEHYVILHNQVPRYVHRDLCYAAMAKYVALHNATYLAIATVFGPKNQELLMLSHIHHPPKRVQEHHGEKISHPSPSHSTPCWKLRGSDPIGWITGSRSLPFMYVLFCIVTICTCMVVMYI